MVLGQTTKKMWVGVYLTKSFFFLSNWKRRYELYYILHTFSALIFVVSSGKRDCIFFNTCWPMLITADALRIPLVGIIGRNSTYVRLGVCQGRFFFIFSIIAFHLFGLCKTIHISIICNTYMCNVQCTYVCICIILHKHICIL